MEDRITPATTTEDAVLSLTGSDLGVGSVPIADYRDDWQATSPKAGWAYQINSGGAIGTASGYTGLVWNPANSIYSFSSSSFPAGNPGQYVLFSGTGGHPGGGTSEGAGVDRYGIASYTIGSTGAYAITNSFVNRTAGTGELDVRVYVDDALKLQATQAVANQSFNVDLGIVNAGQKVYVAIGPKGTHNNDGYSLDFTIAQAAYITAVNSSTSVLGAAVSASGGVVTYNPTAAANLQTLVYGASASDSVSVTYQIPGGGTATASIPVTVTGLPDPPDPQNDTANTAINASAAINVLANDTVSGLLMADFRDDFQGPISKSGWGYRWNSAGAIGTAANYGSLSWTGSTWDGDGLPGLPASGNAQYVYFGAAGAVHPGGGTAQGAGVDRFAIAEYTVPVTGNYSITESDFHHVDMGGADVELRVYVDDTLLSSATIPQTAATTTFNQSLGVIQSGHKIFVCVGPASDHSNDGAYLDFSIRLNSSPTISSVPATSAMGATLSTSGGTITYNPSTSAAAQLIGPGQTGTDTFQYTVTEPGVGTKSATVTVTLLGVFNNNMNQSGTGGNNGSPDTITLKLAPGGAQRETYVNGVLFSSVPVGVAGPLAFIGSADNDTLVVDFTNGNPIPAGGLSFDGGAGADALTLTGGATTTVTHNTLNSSSGSIVLAGALAGTITYTGLEPINDNLSAVDRVFNFVGGSTAVPGMLHQWTFNDLADTTPNDFVGTSHGALFNGASVVSGGAGQGLLSLDGVNDYMRTSVIGENITTKTLVVWVRPNNLAQQSGGVLTLENPTGSDVFDSIDYAERTASQWMSGSNGFARSPVSNGGAGETVTDPGEVMIAISYAADNSITLYRNGVQYGSPYTMDSLQTYPTGIADILLGLRHEDRSGDGGGTAGGNDAFFAGLVNEARVYGVALSAAQIAQIYTEGPVVGAPTTDEVITLADAAGAAMTIDSNLSESITFANPTNSITINTGVDSDTLNINSMDLGFTGALIVDGGSNTDFVNINNSLSLGSVNINAEFITIGSVTLTTTGNQTYSGFLSLNGSMLNPGAGTVVIAGNLTTVASGSTSIILGQVGLNGLTQTFTVADGPAAVDLSISGAVSNGGLTKAGTGALQLSGNNTYAGTTTISAGTLRLFGGSAIPDGAGKGNVVVQGTLDLNGASETINGLSGGGVVTNSGAAATITVGGNDQSSSFAGSFTGALGLTKTGAGTLILGGASAYTGATTINQGTLKLAPNAPVPGASLKLWLDAADAASIAADGSGFISQWNDKSASLGGGGAGTVTQVTAATGNRPKSGVASQSGRNLVRFDGNDGLFGSAVLAAGDDDYTYFAVWKPNVNNVIQDVFEQNSSTLQGGKRASMLAVNAAYGFNGESNDAHTLVPFAPGAWRTTTLEVNNALFDGTNNIRILDNGTQFLGRTGNPAGLDVGAGGISVGYKLVTSFGEGLNGDLAEILVYDSILSATDRQSVLDYLNAKWFGTLPGSFLPTTTAVTVATGATLDTSGSSITIGSLAGGLGSVAMGAGTLTVGDSSSTIFGGVVSGTGGLTKVGGGTLTLLGANTYIGPTNISAGTIKLGSQPATTVPVANNSFEAPTVSSGNGYQTPAGTSWTGGAVVTNTSTLGYSQPASVFGVQAGLIQQTSSITQTIVFPFAGTYNLSFSAANRNCCVAPAGNPLQIKIDNVVASATVTAPGTTYSVMNMQFTVPTAGSHTFTLAGTSAPDRTTFVDNLTITSVASAPTVLPDGSPVTIASGAFLDIAGISETVGSLFGTGTVTNSGAPATITIGGDNAPGASFGGVVQNGVGVTSLTKAGTGTQTLTGTNTFTGPTTVSAGTLTLSGGTALSDSSDVTVTGTLNITTSETIGSLAGAGSVTLASGITLSTGASGASTTFSGPISGAAGVTKVGGGVFTVAGFNTYTGPTNIQTGTLRLANSSAAPVANGSFESPAVSSGNGFQSPAGDFWTGGAVVTNSSTLGYSQPASAFGVQAGLLQNLGSVSQSIVFPLAGNYNLTFSAAGRNCCTAPGPNPLQVKVDGVNFGAAITPAVSTYNSYSVPFVIATAGAHTIQIAGTNAAGDKTSFIDNVIITGAFGVPVTSPVTVAGAATFDINGTSAAVDSVAGTGTINNSNAAAASLTIGVNNAVGMSFGGVIQNGTGPLAITKAGTGDLTLTGNNTYTGATTVSTGVLNASGGVALPDGSAVVVAAGATLNVQNTEIIGSLAGSGSVNLASGITLTTGLDNTATTFDGVLAGANANLIKAGSGVFTFGGNNTYGGSTLVQGGTLKLLGISSVTVPNNSFETPAVVAANGFEGTVRAPWTGTSATVTNTSTLGYSQPASAFGTQAALIQQTNTLSQAITFPSAGAYSLNFWAAGRNTNGSANPLLLSVDGVPIAPLVTAPINVYTFFSIPFSVAAAGSHTVTFTGTSTIDRTTFLDNVTITSVLSVPSSSPVTVNGGAFLDLNGGSVSVTTLAGAGTVTNSSASAAALFVGVNNGSGANFAGVIQNGSSSVAFSKIGSGVQTLSGANTFTGTATVSAGMLTISGGAAIANTVDVTVASGATLNVAASETIGSLSGPIGSAATLAGGATLDLGGNGASTTFAGVMSGGGGIAKSGAGTFTVSGNNTYGGATGVSQGTVKLPAPAGVTAGTNFNLETPQGPFNTGSPDFATNGGYWYNAPAAQTGWTFLAGSGLARSGSAFGLPTNNAQGGSQVIFLQNTGNASQSLTLVPGYYTLSFWSGFRQGQATNPINVSIGATNLFSALNTGSNSAWTNFTVNFTIVTPGNYSLKFAGTNAVGDLTSFIDTISLTGVPAGVSSNFLPDASTVTVASGAFLEMSGNSEAVGSLLGGGTITSTAPVAVTLTVGGDNLASADFTGVIQNGPAPGTVALTKIGSGSQILSGNNTYTGGTLVSTGKLIVNGSLADGPAATDLTVNSNATLGGRGAVAGTVSVANLGHLAPGNGVDTITLSNAASSIAFTPGAIYDVEFGGTAIDKTIVATVPTLTGVTLNLAYIGPVSPLPTQNTYIILDNQTTSPLTTIFSGLIEGALVPVTGANWPSGYRAFITYTAGVGGNDVGIYIDQPEPPVANPDPTSFPNANYSVLQDTLLSTNAANGVLANDTDPDFGAVLTVVSASATSANGAIVVVNANGSFSYDPRNAAALRALAVGQLLTDTFQYTITDGTFTASATVSIQVTGVNDPPTLSNPATPVVVFEGGAANNSGTFNDFDLTDNVAITATIAGVPVGSINKTGTNAGSWTWAYNTTNGPSQSGTVTITANDSHGGIATRTFQLVVNNVPPAFSLPASVTLTPANGGLLALPNIPFTDPGADVWIGTADFGDGAGLLPVAVNQGAKTFSLSHNYQIGGTYTVSVTIDDQDPGGAVTHTLTVTVPQPAATYADDNWAGFALGTPIADADPVAGGDQPAVFGYDAFASVNLAVLAVQTGGPVTVNAGTYHETATIGKTVAVTFQEGPILIDSLSDTVSTATLTLGGITLSLGAGSLSSPVGGSGGVTKVGPGALTFTGLSANTYAGTTRVNDGVLALAKTGVQSVVGPVVIGDGDNNTQPANIKTAILRVSTSNQIADTSAISLTGADGRLHIMGGVTETIASPTFAAGDVKIGGTLTVIGNYVQSGGSTTMAGGTLRVGVTGILDFSLAGTLQGSGTIYTKMLTSTGTIDPSSGVADADIGNASPGFLNIRGNLQMTSSGITNLDVGPVSDQLNVGINTALSLPAGSYTFLSNYDLDPYLRGDVGSVNEPTRRGVNDPTTVNGVVRLDGTLNTRPIAGFTPANNATLGNSMNFVWRALNLPVGDLNPRNATLASVPSDFSARNSFTAAGVPVAPAAPAGNTRFEARFMGSAGQANAVGQSVVVVSGSNAVLAAPAYVVGQAKSLTLTSLASPAGSNPDLKVTKQVWNAMKDSHTRVTVTVTNTGATALNGPFYLVLASVPSGSVSFNHIGRTQAGRPYLVVVPRDSAGNALSTFAPGATATVEVDLLTPLSLSKTAALTANVLFDGLP